MRIFVSIVSYRDPLLYHTVMSLIENKSGMCAVKIGIFEQTKFEDSLASTHPELIDKSFIQYKRIDPEYSDGVGWARHLNALQMEESDFYYQIDSHALFDKNWDRELIYDYQLAVKKYNNSKIVVTSNCKNYHLDENGQPVKELLHPVTCKSTYFAFPQDRKLLAHGEWVDANPDVTDAIHIFAGNLFTRSDWIRDVGINPKMFFTGEEQYLTMASFASGYQLCHPREIHCYHFIGSNDYVTKQWIKPIVSDKQIKRNQNISDKEFYSFLMGINDETYEAYRKYSGVDYINRKLESRALSWSFKAPSHMINDWEIPDR